MGTTQLHLGSQVNCFKYFVIAINRLELNHIDERTVQLTRCIRLYGEYIYPTESPH